MSQRGPLGKNVWVAIILSASLFLSGYSFFSWVHPSHPIAAWISVTVLGFLLIIGWAVLLRQQPKTKLVIHRAVYGAGPETDTDVAETLRNTVQDGLVIPVDNDLVPRDLAKGTRKRLEVQYSYGNGAVCYAYRLESTQGDFVRLVLPEDSELEKRAAEVTRLAEALEQSRLELDRHKAEAAAARESRLPTQRPHIVPIRYGKHSDGHYGLFIENSGEPAFDVSVATPVAVGDAKLVFQNDFPHLTKANGTVLLTAWIEKQSHIIDLGDLFEAMRSRSVASINFPIRYKDEENRFYITTCKIERDPARSGGLAVRYVEQKLEGTAQPKLSQYPVPQLRGKIVAMISELQGFLGEQGQEPEVKRQHPESPEEFQQRWRSIVPPWKARFAGACRLRFKTSLGLLRDEIQVRTGLSDSILNAEIQRVELDPNLDVALIEGVIQRFWNMALGVNT